MSRNNKKNRIKKRISNIKCSGNYETFIEYIRRGKFAMPYCKTCRKNIWPPTDYCTRCLNKMELIDLQKENGKLIEILYSFVGQKEIIRSNDGITDCDIIGLVDFDGVKLLGSINKKTYNDFTHMSKKNFQKSHLVKFIDYSKVHVKLKKCGICKNKIFYEFELVSTK